MSSRDPFYQEFYNTSAATMNAQPMLQSAPQVSMSSHLNESSLQAVREIVRTEVRKALNEIITEIRMRPLREVK